MALVFSTLGLLMVISVGALGLGIVAAFVGIAFGLPVGWAIVLSLYSFAFARNGWKMLSAGHGLRPMRHNGEAAFAVLTIAALVGGLAFAFSDFPGRISALWGLTLPLIVIPGLIIQVAAESVLNVLLPRGRRP